MQVHASGTAALLVELADLDAVLAHHAGLVAEPPPGVLDLVPAARTVLVVVDPTRLSLVEAERWVRSTPPRPGVRAGGAPLEVPVGYDGEDLGDVARALACTPAQVVRWHTGQPWTVAFCGFAPGFGYLVADPGSDPDAPARQVPRRRSPRTAVPAGSVALAGEFTGVYPRSSPGGWQLVGRTRLAVFDPGRDPAALLVPGRPVRFVDVGPVPP